MNTHKQMPTLTRHCAMGDLTLALVSVLTSLLMARRSLERSACRSATAWNCAEGGCKQTCSSFPHRRKVC